jgi:hypothetical protein
MNTIKLVKDSQKDLCNENEDWYYITGTENYCQINKVGKLWWATMYEMGDTSVHTVYADTPRKSANLLLANFDLKLGMEAE